uniref:Uncharacterized protein n=1 Tax=viral metagenome TaxID=1070528 RepID=A0A6C0CBF0_9ZZZZ
MGILIISVKTNAISASAPITITGHAEADDTGNNKKNALKLVTFILYYAYYNTFEDPLNEHLYKQILDTPSEKSSMSFAVTLGEMLKVINKQSESIEDTNLSEEQLDKKRKNSELIAQLAHLMDGSHDGDLFEDSDFGNIRKKKEDLKKDLITTLDSITNEFSQKLTKDTSDTRYHKEKSKLYSLLNLEKNMYIILALKTIITTVEAHNNNLLYKLTLKSDEFKKAAEAPLADDSPSHSPSRTPPLTPLSPYLPSLLPRSPPPTPLPTPRSPPPTPLLTPRSPPPQPLQNLPPRSPPPTPPPTPRSPSPYSLDDALLSPHLPPPPPPTPPSSPRSPSSLSSSSSYESESDDELILPPHLTASIAAIAATTTSSVIEAPPISSSISSNSSYNSASRPSSPLSSSSHESESNDQLIITPHLTAAIAASAIAATAIAATAITSATVAPPTSSSQQSSSTPSSSPQFKPPLSINRLQLEALMARTDAIEAKLKATTASLQYIRDNKDNYDPKKAEVLQNLANKAEIYAEAAETKAGWVPGWAEKAAKETIAADERAAARQDRRTGVYGFKLNMDRVAVQRDMDEKAEAAFDKAAASVALAKETLKPADLEKAKKAILEASILFNVDFDRL